MSLESTLPIFMVVEKGPGTRGPVRAFAALAIWSIRCSINRHAAAGYPATLYAHVLTPNWIFYRFTDTEVHFLHIRDGRRGKGDQKFEQA